MVRLGVGNVVSYFANEPFYEAMIYFVPCGELLNIRVSAHNVSVLLMTGNGILRTNQPIFSGFIVFYICLHKYLTESTRRII